jgi:hypothetical protein
MRSILPMVLGAAFVALVAHPSLAQTGAEPDDLVTSDDCEVAPADDAPAPESPDSLCDTLAPCNGVLAPAPVGDGEMTIDPPALGETPIIPPELVPPQPPQE